MSKKRFPDSEEQRIIYDILKEHFVDQSAQPGGVLSVDAEEDTIHWRNVFVEDGNYQSEPVAVLARAALRDAMDIDAVRNLNPNDFFGS